MDILSGEKFCWTVTECISWFLTGKIFLRSPPDWRGDSKKSYQTINKSLLVILKVVMLWEKTEELPLSIQNLLM